MVIKETLRVLRHHPEISIYFYTSTAFILLTLPIVSTTIFAKWYNRLFSEATFVPHKAGLILGLVGFSAFYVALVTAYFTCAVSISVIAKLEDLKVPPFYGLLRVIKNFFRVTVFALLAVFFFPLGVYAQRKKLPGGWLGILGSSLTLHMAQVAPAVLTTNHKVGATLRESIDTLGRAWRESLILKIGMYFTIFLIFVLPKLIQKGLFEGHTASNIGWIISIELGASSLIAFKVLNSIFTAVLYHHARQNQNN
jgi:hypothetical protein